jgi:hypothetical protein
MDQFLSFCAADSAGKKTGVSVSPSHAERKHSKFSASGAERWFNCPGSVELSEGMPDRTTVYSEEGTLAHELLELILVEAFRVGFFPEHVLGDGKCRPIEMQQHCFRAAEKIWNLWRSTPGAEGLAEVRVSLDFIHPEAFGTFDAAVVDHFGTLHVFDYKYGAGHAVSAVENLQMLFYAIGLAHRYDWNFKCVRMWIIQPRIAGYDGPTFWEVSIEELSKKWVAQFSWSISRVQENPDKFEEGEWCHWCKAKSKCPLKLKRRFDEAKMIFGPVIENRGKNE